MLTTLIVGLAALVQPQPGHPPTWTPPACLHVDPDWYYRPLEERPGGVSDECWWRHEMEDILARIEYAGCVSACMNRWANDPIIMCICFDDCGRAWKNRMALADADVVICAAQ